MKNFFFLLSVVCLAFACSDDEQAITPAPDSEPSSSLGGLLFHAPLTGTTS